MQKRNLKALVPEKKPKPWYYWLNPLNYTPAKLYRSFLDKYVGMSDGVATYYYYDTVPEVENYDLSRKAKTYSLPEDRAKVNAFNLGEIKKRRSFSYDFPMRRPRISNPLEFEHPVKWVLLNIKRTVRLREAKLSLNREPKLRAFKDFDVKRRLRLKEIESERLHIKDYVAVQEEMMEIFPYLQVEPLETIYQVPMVKKQLNKGLISQRSLDKIRNVLAQHVQVNSLDVEIVGVYENFQYELYRNIKHSATTGDVLCFLDPNKRNIRKLKSPYLLIGKRRSTGQSFTVLVDKEKLAV